MAVPEQSGGLWSIVYASVGGGMIPAVVSVFLRWRRNLGEQSKDVRDRREKALVDGLGDLSSGQRQYIDRLTTDRDECERRLEALERELSLARDWRWRTELWGRDMRHAAGNARQVVNAMEQAAGKPATGFERLDDPPEERS
ncbi:MAG: hypothetical protein JO209_07765 [Acidisphaera sp.]|nr:hypothetical protein [Acidisphaera sp.]